MTTTELKQIRMAIDAVDIAKDKESAMYRAIGVFRKVVDKYDRRRTPRSSKTRT